MITNEVLEKVRNWTQGREDSSPTLMLDGRMFIKRPAPTGIAVSYMDFDNEGFGNSSKPLGVFKDDITIIFQDYLWDNQFEDPLPVGFVKERQYKATIEEDLKAKVEALSDNIQPDTRVADYETEINARYNSALIHRSTVVGQYDVRHEIEYGANHGYRREKTKWDLARDEIEAITDGRGCLFSYPDTDEAARKIIDLIRDDIVREKTIIAETNKRLAGSRDAGFLKIYNAVNQYQNDITFDVDVTKNGSTYSIQLSRDEIKRAFTNSNPRLPLRRHLKRGDYGYYNSGNRSLEQEAKRKLGTKNVTYKDILEIRNKSKVVYHDDDLDKEYHRLNQRLQPIKNRAYGVEIGDVVSIALIADKIGKTPREIENIENTLIDFMHTSASRELSTDIIAAWLHENGNYPEYKGGSVSDVVKNDCIADKVAPVDFYIADTFAEVRNALDMLSDTLKTGGIYKLGFTSIKDKSEPFGKAMDEYSDMFKAEHKGMVPKIIRDIAISGFVCGFDAKELVKRFDVKTVKAMKDAGIPVRQIPVLYMTFGKNDLMTIVKNQDYGQISSVLVDGYTTKDSGRIEKAVNVAKWLLKHPNVNTELFEDINKYQNHLEITPGMNTDAVQALVSKAHSVGEMELIEDKYDDFKFKDCRFDLKFCDVTWKGYDMQILRPGDTRMATLGYDTCCCQHLGSAGETAMMYGLVQPNAGFWAMTDHKTGKVLAQAEIWTSQIHDNKLIGTLDIKHDMELNRQVGRTLEEFFDNNYDDYRTLMADFSELGFIVYSIANEKYVIKNYDRNDDEIIRLDIEAGLVEVSNPEKVLMALSSDETAKRKINAFLAQDLTGLSNGLTTRLENKGQLVQYSKEQTTSEALVFDNIEFADDKSIEDYKEAIGVWCQACDYQNVIMGAGYNEMDFDGLIPAELPTMEMSPDTLWILNNDATDFEGVDLHEGVVQGIFESEGEFFDFLVDSTHPGSLPEEPIGLKGEDVPGLAPEKYAEFEKLVAGYKGYDPSEYVYSDADEECYYLKKNGESLLIDFEVSKEQLENTKGFSEKQDIGETNIDRLSEIIAEAAERKEQISVSSTLDGEVYNVSAQDFLKGLSRASRDDEEFPVKNGTDITGRPLSAKFTAESVISIAATDGHMLYRAGQTTLPAIPEQDINR